jgi:hypothetical protein
MSVKVTSFDDGSGMWEYAHGDAPGGSHGGTLDPETVSYVQNVDGTENRNIIAVPCPECGSVSYWPPGGGADAVLGQSLHVVMEYQSPVVAAGRGVTPMDASEVVKQRVIDTDGEQRWVLDDVMLEALRTLALR